MSQEEEIMCGICKKAFLCLSEVSLTEKMEEIFKKKGFYVYNGCIDICDDCFIKIIGVEK